MYKSNREILGSDRFDDVKSIIGDKFPISLPDIAINKIHEHLDFIKEKDLDTFSLEALVELERRIVVLLDAENCLKEYLDQYNLSKTSVIIRIKDLLK